MAESKSEHQPETSTPGRVAFLDGQSELPMLEVSTVWSTAEIYLHGAHVTRFQKKDEAPLLFMSQCSRFSEEAPIRGGIPVIFPWFGQREGLQQHGFARIKAWEVKEVAPRPDGSVSVRFRLPDCPEASVWPAFSADYVVTVDQALTLELIVTNQSTTQVLTFENCLHTYFGVSDVRSISITGLKRAKYLDKVENLKERTERNENIRISSEVDRIYLSTVSPVEIIDPGLRRKIRIEKHGSNSTVVWNPWVDKAQAMPDFGNEEYEKMVCIESGNVGPNSVQLAPGETSTLRVRLTTTAG